MWIFSFFGSIIFLLLKFFLKNEHLEIDILNLPIEDGSSEDTSLKTVSESDYQQPTPKVTDIVIIEKGVSDIETIFNALESKQKNANIEKTLDSLDLDKKKKKEDTLVVIQKKDVPRVRINNDFDLWNTKLKQIREWCFKQVRLSNQEVKNIKENFGVKNQAPVCDVKEIKAKSLKLAFDYAWNHNKREYDGFYQELQDIDNEHLDTFTMPLLEKINAAAVATVEQKETRRLIQIQNQRVNVEKEIEALEMNRYNVEQKITIRCHESWYYDDPNPGRTAAITEEQIIDLCCERRLLSQRLGFENTKLKQLRGLEHIYRERQSSFRVIEILRRYNKEKEEC